MKISSCNSISLNVINILMFLNYGLCFRLIGYNNKFKALVERCHFINYDEMKDRTSHSQANIILPAHRSITTLQLTNQPLGNIQSSSNTNLPVQSTTDDVKSKKTSGGGRGNSKFKNNSGGRGGITWEKKKYINFLRPDEVESIIQSMQHCISNGEDSNTFVKLLKVR